MRVSNNNYRSFLSTHLLCVLTPPLMGTQKFTTLKELYQYGSLPIQACTFCFLLLVLNSIFYYNYGTSWLCYAYKVIIFMQLDHFLLCSNLCFLSWNLWSLTWVVICGVSNEYKGSVFIFLFFFGVVNFFFGFCLHFPFSCLALSLSLWVAFISHSQWHCWMP